MRLKEGLDDLHDCGMGFERETRWRERDSQWEREESSGEKRVELIHRNEEEEEVSGFVFKTCPTEFRSIWIRRFIFVRIPSVFNFTRLTK